ncbi:MAG: hypothetical protein KA715_05040 [Xanthomonadaceae bacterium]|nr:hypothetical protein [Xanthomonadaceae bacterium]
MKKTAFLALLVITGALLTVLGCGQATVGKYSGQGVITFHGKSLQQPVSLEVSERLYKDYEGSYTLQTSNYQGNLQLRRAEGELKGRTLFTYTKTQTEADKTTADAKKTADASNLVNVPSCQIELTGTFEIIEDVLNGKLCGQDHACGAGADICVEFKALKRSGNDSKKNTQNDWWSTPQTPTTTINGGYRS